jgi:hypothetical protein
MDNGTINYTGSGSSKVQTYIKNTAAVGNLYIHQIGPTVKNTTFPSTYPGATGVFLNQFQLQSNGSYAYRYTEPTNTWTNFYQPTDPVPTACGLDLSDVSGVSKTLEMTGQLATDDGGVNTFIATPSATTTPTLSQWAVTYTAGGGQGNFLASNPYPSGLDLKLFWSAVGTAGYETTMRIWDPGAGAYATVTRRVTPPGWLYTGVMTGTNGLINPGQGFFVTTLPAYIPANGDQLFFLSTYRAHYFGPFVKESEEVFPSTMYLHASTTANGSNNDLIIYFADGPSSGTDMWDAVHWASMYEEALEVSSLSTDNNELTVNAMPPLTDVVSVPVDFKPGVSGDFTFNFTGLDSFEDGTEIFLEDLQTGANWVDLIANPVYNFTANSDDPLGRYIIHFFGPTGISDPITQHNSIQIYGYGHDAYIVNRGKETVKEYFAYDMMGREIQRGTLPNKSVNILTIGDASAYYVVKVITKEGHVYNGKVYITK